jgi:hypothetical protein
LDDLKERRGYSHLKEEALERAIWRAGFGRGFGPVVNEWIHCHISTADEVSAVCLFASPVNEIK